MRLLALTIALFVCSVVLAAPPMRRVIAVRDVQTLVIDQNGVAAEVRLAGVVVPPSELDSAVDYLRSTLVSHWVLIESSPQGAFVYRSPDALYINGELARRAYTAPHTMMTYLGEIDAGPRTTRVKSGVAPKPVRLLPPAKPHSVRHSPRGAHRIPRF